MALKYPPGGEIIQYKYIIYNNWTCSVVTVCVFAPVRVRMRACMRARVYAFVRVRVRMRARVCVFINDFIAVS